MIILEELRTEMTSTREKIDELGEVLAIARAREELEELRVQASDEKFWEDLETSQKVLQRTKQLENKIAEFEKLISTHEDIVTMIEMCIEEPDEDMIESIPVEIAALKKAMEKKNLETLFSGEYDNSNAILTFHAGAGGTEAMDWAQMLYRMYTQWANKHNFKVQVLDYLDGDEAGLKSATIMIEGENAYGYLKSEAGVHRLVRVSPFDANSRRQTSFAALDVMPEIDDTVEVDIRTEDLRIDTYRSSGAGGQHINKTESAVRITHIPTGVVTACQTQRSQQQNKAYAMKMLRSKLVEIKEQEHLEKVSDIKGVQKEIAWGAQIRSYVFMPYTLAKDTRTGYENGNIQAVMDGDLDGFIHAYLKSITRG